MRPSVEALLHVVCVVDAGATAVAHTHPESVNALLCSDRADVLAGPPIFPDQVVVIGRRALLVPYSDPGVSAGPRCTCPASRTRTPVGHAASERPRNHGMVALGSSVVQVLQLTEMADKVSRVLAATLSLGSVVPMTDESAETYRHSRR